MGAKNALPREILYTRTKFSRISQVIKNS